MNPSIERLYELLRLDAETGRLYWRINSGGVCRTKVGKEAGWRNVRGYRRLVIDGKELPAHHVVFAMVVGRWPVDRLDHRNTIRDDNRPLNLREATNAKNLCNRGANKNNTSGVKGVCWDKQREKWVSQIMVAGKTINLGRHDDLDLAALVYAEAARKYHGEFSRVSP